MSNLIKGLAAAGRKAAAHFSERDVLYFGGLAMLAAGLELLRSPIGLITAGAVLVGTSLLRHEGNK